MKKLWDLLNKLGKNNINNENASQHNLIEGKELKKNLKKNIQHVKDTLGHSSDLATREFAVGESGSIKLCIIYIEGLVNEQSVQQFILKPLMIETRITNLDKNLFNNNKIYEILNNHVITSSTITGISDFSNLYNHLLSGDTIILIDGYAEGFAVSSKGWEDRGVTEPSSQTVVRGPKDGFSETLRTNTSLIRRRIKDPNLRLETKKIGFRTKTEIAIVYIKGIANEDIVKEVHRRLDRINIDGVLESAYIEELIEDETYTLFPTVFNTERPDIVAAGLLEGRIAILVDGTPFALLVPALFIHFFQTSEDYYQRFIISTFIRLLRFLSFFLALLTPSLYIAATTFHQEMIPTTLLISIAAQREGIPFPAFFEALIMEITFEILREAGIRLPRAVGSAISIVGALVLGEAAVQAGLVSPAMVIVVSITAISNFAFPNYSMSISIRMLRFAFMLLAFTFGLYGVAIGLIALVLHLCSLRSFGIPYFSSLGPFIKKDQKDVFLRAPRHQLSTRPSLINQRDIYRQQSPSKAKPKPPQQDE